MCVQITYIHVRGPETIKRWRWNKLLDAFSVWHTHTHTRARGRNVKCIRKLENTKTLGTNEQYYYVYAMHCMRIDFRKIKKKTFSNEMSEKKLRKRHSNRERKRSVYIQQYFPCWWYLFILFDFSSLYSVIDVSAKDRRVTFIILYFIVNVI